MSSPGRGALIALIAAVGALVGACSGQRRSDEFTCARPSDCPSGRDCVGGFCVVEGGGVDGGVGDGGVCPAACSTCQGDLCMILCTDGGCGPIVCPAGMACEVICTGSSACVDGVDCTAATACQVQCQGTRACRAGVECGDGPCEVACAGEGACEDGVDCSDACSCSVTCAGGCASPASCPDLDCQTPQDGCTTQPAADCDRCP